MKGRGLDHLEGYKANNSSPQILASDGTQRQGTRAGQARSIVDTASVG